MQNTHTVQRNGGHYLKYLEKRNVWSLRSRAEGRGGEVASRAEAVPDAKTEVSEREKATGFAAENLRYIYKGVEGSGEGAENGGSSTKTQPDSQHLLRPC